MTTYCRPSRPIITASGVVFIGATTDQYLRAYDLKSGKVLWRARLPATQMAAEQAGVLRGAQHLFPHNLPRVEIDRSQMAPGLGGSIITASGVVFIGATTDQYLRAYDLKSGKVLW
jgi:glucose dehydrogenase